MKKVLLPLVAFALGLTTGVWWTKPMAEVGESPNDAESAEIQNRAGEDETSSDEAEGARQPEVQSQEEEVSVTPATVEVVVDDSPAPEPEVLAAHAARQARRRTAREAKERERRDFFSTLNPDLLTAEQRKTHALFVEANETCTAVRKEISALRVASKEVPAELQARLADAESVLRTDREAERRALREAAARAAGLDEAAVRQLMNDLTSIENAFTFGATQNIEENNML